MRKKRTSPEQIYSFDTEGDAGERGFISGVIVGDKFRFYTEDQNELRAKLWEIAEGNNTIVATNLDYDLAVAFQDHMIDVRMFYAGDRMLYATLNDSEAKGQFVDTVRAIGYYSVATLGKMIGKKKLHTPCYLKKHTHKAKRWICRSHMKMECLECYNYRDAEITREAYLMFSQVVESLGAKLQKTIASTAANLWQSMGLERGGIALPQEYDPLCREAYYGGRTEVFTLGEVENLNQYDINSEYPYVMAEMEFPDIRRLRFHKADTPWKDVRDKYGVANVTIEVPKMRVPPLPVRHEGKLVFPVGVFTGTYVIQEIGMALKYGAKILKVNWALCTSHTVRPFEKYIRTLYALRLEAKKTGNPLENVLKILMNALYGKLGQRLDGELGWLVPWRRKEGEYVGFTNFVGTFDNIMWVIDPIKDHKSPWYLNVLWAAYVTSYGRQLLYKYFDMVDFNVHYCDTDSLFTESELPTSSDLGDIKKEGSGLTCTFLGPKFYKVDRHDGKVKYVTKGCPAHLAMAYFLGEEVEFDSPVSIRSGIKYEERPGKWKKIHRQYHYEFTKRSTDARLTNGLIGKFTTSPLEFTNGTPDVEIDSRTDLAFVWSIGTWECAV